MGHAPWSKAILHASHSDQRDICFGHRSILFTYFFNCVHYDTYIYPDLRTVAFDLEIDVAFPSGSQIMHRYSVWCKWYDMPHFLNLQYHFVKCCQNQIYNYVHLNVFVRREWGFPPGCRAVLPREAPAHPREGRQPEAQHHPAAQKVLKPQQQHLKNIWN